METREEIMGHQFKHQKLRTVLRESTMRNYRVKMAMMGFTFTASIIFIIFSFSSLIPFFLSSLTMFFPGRNYMFFISNFLLALIVKTSGLITNLSPNKDNDTMFSVRPINKVNKSGGSGSGLGSGSIVSRSGSLVTLETKAPSSVGVVEEDEQGAENGVVVAAKEVAAEAAPEKSQEEEEEEIQDEENRLISIDELNKKCDDFIKMMKGGINSMELKPKTHTNKLSIMV